MPPSGVLEDGVHIVLQLQTSREEETVKSEAQGSNEPRPSSKYFHRPQQGNSTQIKGMGCVLKVPKSASPLC